MRYPFIAGYTDKSSVCLHEEHMGINKESVDEAEGIPDRSQYGDLSNLKQGDLVNFLLQLHDAKKSGRHYDMRIESPEGLLSWALPKAELPEPGGKKRLAVQQPLHSKEYKEFEGKIPEGEYGAGTVKKEREDRILITEVKPDSISFVTAGKYPEKFVLRRYKGKDNWLLMNTTPVSDKQYKKPEIKEVSEDEVESLISPNNIFMQKIDGSFQATEITDEIRDLSHRISKKTGRPIENTYATGSYKFKPEGIPQDTVLQSELYATKGKGKKAIPPAKLGALLNAAVANSLNKQKDENLKFKHAVFDLLKYKGKDVQEEMSYEERRELLKDILKKLPKDNFQLIPGETDPEKQRKLYQDIKARKHPVTEEGVVVYGLKDDLKKKLKAYKEFDVILEDWFPAEEGKYSGGAGGFWYRYPEDKPGVKRGKVGTGLTREDRFNIPENESEWIGRRAKVKGFRKEPSGKIYGPVFISRHESYN